MSADSLAGPATSAEVSRLLRAATAGKIEEVLEILNATKAGIKFFSARGTSPLHEAAKGGHVELVEELILRSAEVRDVNKSGCTPLHMAALAKDKLRGISIIELLLRARASVGHTNLRMDTPLHFAAFCEAVPGSIELMLLILSQRAEVNCKNRNGESPLFNAVIHNNSEAVNILLQHGADPSTRDKLENTALDIAKQRGCEEVKALLEKSQDPMHQLSEAVTVMRATVGRLQSMERLSADLQHQSELAEAYEHSAMAAFAELDQAGLRRVATGAVAVVHELGQARPGETDPRVQQLLRVLTTFRMLSLLPNGIEVLREVGVPQILLILESRLGSLRVGLRELHELRFRLRQPEPG